MGQKIETPTEAERQSKLVDYLGALHPNTQAAVLRELEMSELRGDALGPSYRVVMNELRRGIRKSGRVVERVGNPSRVFCMPLQPFLINEVPDEPIPATVSRPSLMPIWAWVCRDLMPAEAKAYIDTARQALLADDRPSAVAAAAVFQDKFVAATEPLLAAKTNAALQKRLSAYGAPPTALSDLRGVFFVLSNRDALREIGKIFPTKIQAIDDAAAERVSAMLAALPPDDPTMLSHALAVVMSQLSPHCQIVRFAASGPKVRNAIAELVLGRAQAKAAGLRMAKWSIEQIHEAADKAQSLRATIDMVRSTLRPGADDPEDRRCRQIEEMVERFQAKIALTMANVTRAPIATSGPRGGEMFQHVGLAEQAALA